MRNFKKIPTPAKTHRFEIAAEIHTLDAKMSALGEKINKHRDGVHKRENTVFNWDKVQSLQREYGELSHKRATLYKKLV